MVESTYFTPSAEHSLFALLLYAHSIHLPATVEATMQSALASTHCGKEETQYFVEIRRL